MKKIVLIVVAVLVVLCVIFFIVKKIVGETPKENPKQLELTYEMNAGIPFKWEYEIEDETVVKFVKSYVAKDDNKNGVVGASVYTNYVFEGLKEGTTTITFKTVSITGEYPDSNIEKNVVKVDKDLNISLVKEGE